jgi:nitroreductase
MIDAIAKRASCRAYKPDPVPDEAVTELVHAALSAPSANNARPYHVIVVRDPAKRAVLATVHQYASFCAQSPVVIVICAEAEKSQHWWIEDCCAAVENVLIQATALGLGSCWIGLRGNPKWGRDYDRESKVREVCGIPENIRVEALITIGYPATDLRPKGPGPLEHIHTETW